MLKFVGGVLGACLLPLLTVVPNVCNADEWPNRPITVVDSFPAGGGTDVAMRSIQPLLQQELGQTVLIDNRPGAGGTIGASFVAKARPDGYTAGIATTSTHATAASLYTHLPYDPQKDFEYVGFIGTTPYVLAVNPALKATTVEGLIALIKADPSKYSIASVGAGTVSHLIAEQFKASAGLSIVHVPYRGAAPAYTDLIGGQVQLLFDNPIGLAPYIQANKLLGIAATAPSTPLPNVPTFEQQGIKGFTQTLWYGIVLPKGTSRPIVERFNQALNKVLANPTLQADMASRGLTLKPSTPADFKNTAAADLASWAKVVKAIGITLD